MPKDRARNSKRKFDTSALSKMGNALGFYTGNVETRGGTVRATSKAGDHRVLVPGKGHVTVGEKLPFTGSLYATEYSPADKGTRGITKQ